MNRVSWLEGYRGDLPDWRGYYEGSKFYVAGEPWIHLTLQYRESEFWMLEEIRYGDTVNKTEYPVRKGTPEKRNLERWDRIISWEPYESIKVR